MYKVESLCKDWSLGTDTKLQMTNKYDQTFYLKNIGFVIFTLNNLKPMMLEN